MSLPKFEFVAPKTVAGAISLQKDNAKFIAGGTDLLVAMKRRISSPSVIIDLNKISNLKRIKWNKKDGLRIGPLITLTQLKENPLVGKHLPGLSQIVPLISAPQLQNMGTIGGNLCLDARCYYYNQPVFLKKKREPCLKAGGQVCHVVKSGNRCHAVYSGDMAAPLMALGTRVKITGYSKTKELALRKFFSGSGIKPNILKSDELLTDIIVPPQPESSGFSYRKLRLRDTLDFPLLGVAVFIDLDEKDGRCKDFCLILSAVGPSPVVVEAATKMMRGKRMTPKLMDRVAREAQKKAHPVDNAASSPGYRREMVRVLIKKAIREALIPFSKV
ncbi:putative 4-hydroxybenzoyl-CoA reductase, beta subunit [delta proteobacterium NaphS2]|nr:putative 4-hydroxybenzoyl-CoA reductase, beta subunit [delta proteobacterium NaphS2]